MLKYKNGQWTGYATKQTKKPISKTVASITVEVPIYSAPSRGTGGQRVETGTVEKTASITVSNSDGSIRELSPGKYRAIINALEAAGIPNVGDHPHEKALTKAVDDLASDNAGRYQYNQWVDNYNAKADKKNAVYDKIVQAANTTRGGDYATQRSAIEKYKNEIEDAGLKLEDLIESYDDFYKAEKINVWDTAKGAQPPNSKEKGFDAKYYLDSNPDIKAKWDEALKAGDLDIIATYSNNGVPDINAFALADYTYAGKPAGKRGNAAELLNLVQDYVEKAPTDQEKQFIKDDLLGVSYQQLKQYAPKKGEIETVLKEGFQEPPGEDEKRADTTLETILGEELGADIIKKTNQFGALAQDTLKATIAEMQQAKKKEMMLSTMGNLAGFNEVFNFNKTLAEGLIGDTGIGGILSLAGGKKAVTRMEEGLKGLTGANNNTIYNWQQWFDSELSKRYAQDMELGLKEGDVERKIQVDADFAKQYIQQYLAPRFNESKNMNQFTEYIDVFDPEGKFQNPLQTQDILNAAVDAALLQNKTYLDQIDALKDKTFDSNFYFNPSDNLVSQEAKDLADSKSLQDLYAKQASTVASDWEEAKKQVQNKDGYWYEQAYKYGVDVNDKDAFARLHYQTVGNKEGFDPVENFATNAKIQDYIYMKVLPAIKDKTINMSIFGNFLTPKNISDQLFAAAGVDPKDQSTWNKMLELFKIKDFKGSYADLETYVTEYLSGNSALEVQEKIKDLQKEGVTPTQENLGVYYIPRAADKAGEAEPKTGLYSTFKSAGYQGTEDEFYEEFFPDLSKQEQQLLTKDGLKGFLDLDLSDPYKALGGIEGLLGDEDEGDYMSMLFSLDDQEEKETPEEEEDLFGLGFGSKSNKITSTKSKSGTDLLNEFTSFMKF